MEIDYKSILYFLDETAESIYLISLAALLYYVISTLGGLYPWLWFAGTVIFYLVQKDDDLTFAFRIIKCMIVSGIGITCFDATVTSRLADILMKDIRYMYVGLLLLTLMMNQSVLYGDVSKDKKYWFVKNAVIMLILFFALIHLYGIGIAPLGMINTNYRFSGLLKMVVLRVVQLSFMFSVNHLLGGKPSDLLGFKEYSVKKFLRYFFMGMLACAIAWQTRVLLVGLLFPSKVVFSAQNLVSWEGAAYFATQSVTLFYVLIQTLYEEILFRTIVYSIWEGCRFSKAIKKPYGGESRYYIDLVLTSFMMSAWFAGVHLKNPTESGYNFKSLLEKFFVYLENFAFSFSFLLMGNLAFSWGMHAGHNASIRALRYSDHPADNGFSQHNLVVDKALPSEKIMGSAMVTVAGILTVLLAKCYGDHVDAIEERSIGKAK